jgi:hypothetical protein
MDDKFIINKAGREMVLYAGLLDEAHAQGLKRITTYLVQIPSDENGGVAIVSAEVETAKGTFSGIGDADKGNTNRMVLPHLIRFAETRAKARALRDAINLGNLDLADEGPINDNDGDNGKPSPERKQTTDYSRKNGNSTPPEAAGPVESSGDEELDGLLQQFAEGTKLPPPQAERQACKGGSIPAGTTLATATDQQRENAKRWLKSMLAKPGRP